MPCHLKRDPTIQGAVIGVMGLKERGVWEVCQVLFHNFLLDILKKLPAATIFSDAGVKGFAGHQGQQMLLS